MEVGWGGVKKYPSFTCNLTTPPSRDALSQDYWMVAKLLNHLFWLLMLFYTPSLLLLQPSVLWLSIVTLNDAKLPPEWILREFDVSRIRPRQGGWRLHGKISTQLRGLPGLADQVTQLSGSPHLSCKRDQIKMRYYMVRQVTPPKCVTSPAWGPSPWCKQALS